MIKTIKIALAALICLAAVFAASTVALADDSAVKDIALTVSKDMPPVTALEDTGAFGWRTGCDIKPYKSGSSWYLFLPSSADLTAVLLRYDGDLQLYDDDTGILYAHGATMQKNFTAGESCIYEYDAAAGEYIRYSLSVMKAGDAPTGDYSTGACATIYLTLDGGDDALLTINSSHWAVETGVILMTENDGTLIYQGDLTRMKGHGLTSYDGSGKLNTKNSYNINIGSKAELIDGAGKSRKWTLLKIRTNGNYDATGMSYITAFYTYNALIRDSYFNLASRFVDVYINGEYRGAYILTERMDINGSMQITDLEENTLYDSTSTKTVTRSKKDDPAIAAGIESYSYATGAYLADGVSDITGGYVLEIMCGTYGECGFKTNAGMFVNVKSPAYATHEQMQYIAEYVQEFENALFSDTGYNSLGKHYSDYADMDSYAAQTIVYAFYLNWEIYRTSTYIHKDVDGSEHGKLTFGPVWDFESGPNVMGDDTLFGQIFSYDVEQQYIWFEQAWKKGDYLHYVAQLNEHMQSIVAQMLGYEDATEIFTLERMIADVKPSQEMNWIRWKQPDTYDKRAAGMTSGLEMRFNTWFNTIWNGGKYLLGLTASARQSDDGGVEMTAQAYGKNSGDYTWYKVDDTFTEGTKVGEGESYTASDDGLYYCAVSGPNNAYCGMATGKVFRKQTLTVISNVVDTSDLSETAQSVLLTYNASQITPTVQNDVAADTGAIETEHTQPVDTVEKSGGNNTGYIIFAAAVVALSAAAAFIFGSKKQGGAK